MSSDLYFSCVHKSVVKGDTVMSNEEPLLLKRARNVIYHAKSGETKYYFCR